MTTALLLAKRYGVDVVLQVVMVKLDGDNDALELSTAIHREMEKYAQADLADKPRGGRMAPIQGTY